ncbi:alpha-L-arabinofuranosidase C-terminal domain-containing protein, partial [Parabacteroides distasonis]
FDNLRMMRTPNYYVQQMYGMNAGTDVVPLTMDGKAVTGQDSLYASAVTDANTGELIVKLVNAGTKPADVKVNVNGLKKRALVSGSCTYLQNCNLRAVNTLDGETVVPRVRPVTVSGNELSLKLAPQSFGVYRIQMK